MGGALYALGGWPADCALGLAFCALAFASYATEFIDGRKPAAEPNALAE